MAALAMIGAGSGRVNAAFVVNLTQSGGSVVAVGSGTLNTAALTFNDSGSFDGRDTINGPVGEVLLGTNGSGRFSIYSGISGPSRFGTGTGNHPDIGIGDFLGIGGGSTGFGANGSPTLVVPQGYVSGSPLSTSDTWLGQTFATMGLTQGTYVWTWGSGINADSFTMNIGPASVPEPSSLALCGVGGMALTLAGKWRRCRLATTPPVVV